MNINEYIMANHDGSPTWFVNEVSLYHHQARIMDILDKKEYLSGIHAISKRPSEYYNGKLYEPRKIVLQHCKTIINFSMSYLLHKPVTITGAKSVVEQYKKVYKKGKFDAVDFALLGDLIKYGNAYEYPYVNNGIIKSQLISPEDAYPVYDERNEMIAFVEHFTTDSIDYYTVYYPDRVDKWNNAGGDLHVVGSFVNVSGLPIHYHSDNELDHTFGRSDLDDYINILDHMEDILSKFGDSFYKHHNPLSVVIGQQLKGEGINPNIVGTALVLDDGSDFKMVGNQLDYQSFETIYKTLRQALLDIASVPAVSFNSQDVSNLSEVSIKLLFSLADIKANMNEKYMRAGFEQRFSMIKDLLGMLGQQVSDDEYDTLGVGFEYSRPSNEKDIIDNLKVLRDMQAISLETVLENSPYVTDTAQELQRLSTDKVNVGQ